VLPLDTAIDDPVDLYVGTHLIAAGELEEVDGPPRAGACHYDHLFPVRGHGSVYSVASDWLAAGPSKYADYIAGAVLDVFRDGPGVSDRLGRGLETFDRRRD